MAKRQFRAQDAVDILNPTTEELNKIDKRIALVPTNKGHFVEVTCGNCDSISICYSHTQREIACKECEEVIFKNGATVGIVSESCSMKVLERKL